ncbi:hypothetical protein [Edaphobacter modestus]|uniref:Uncharacterized protein n=1 Tax=Edaphobacter modestus TaxID=388466 RepID=A0A4Q7YTB8_9BACT|nr:hypothetical protein [Edaphobacter modestus]RZU40800.1 hypothetical protein BDD14_2283 [Edaphobacter modestus]
MIPDLKVTYLYHDADVIEVRVAAENAEFRGTADVYVGTDGLLEAAAALEGFPKNGRDRREVTFGAAGKQFAGGSVHLKFYCKDMAGHATFRATIEGDYGDMDVAESAIVHVDFDPASLDQFLVELRQVEIDHRGSASMITGAS